MFDEGDRFTLVALEGRAAGDGELGVTYTVLKHRGTKYWMERDDGGRGISGVPEDELADPAIWQPA